MRTAFFKIYDNLSQYSFNFNYGESIFPFKVISLIISALFIAIIIFLLIKIRKDIEKFLGQAVESIAAPGLPKREMNKSWQIVLDKLESVEKDSYKMAVIEADKIFDDIIKRIGYKGDDMGERLKQINPAQILIMMKSGKRISFVIVWFMNQVFKLTNFRLNDLLKFIRERWKI